MSIDFETIETALATWVKAALAMADQQVYIADQDFKPDPTLNRVNIRIGDIERLGQPEMIRTVDDDEDPEIEDEHLAMCSTSLSIQVFGPKLVGNAGPRSLASKLRASLSLETYKGPLRAARLGIMDVGALRWIPAVVGTKFEGRAQFDVACSLSESAAERWGYIETIKIHVRENGVELARSPFVITMPS